MVVCANGGGAPPARSLSRSRETYLGYLPAAHILELVAEHAMTAMGAAIGFADPRTISSKGACRQRPDGSINTQPEYPHPPGAIQEFRPTVLAGVPKVGITHTRAQAHATPSSTTRSRSPMGDHFFLFCC